MSWKTSLVRAQLSMVIAFTLPFTCQSPTATFQSCARRGHFPHGQELSTVSHFLHPYSTVASDTCGYFLSCRVFRV
jgi:hypothetical protein